MSDFLINTKEVKLLINHGNDQYSEYRYDKAISRNTHRQPHDLKGFVQIEPKELRDLLEKELPWYSMGTVDSLIHFVKSGTNRLVPTQLR